jgi:hypothetical protein
VFFKEQGILEAKSEGKCKKASVGKAECLEGRAKESEGSFPRQGKKPGDLAAWTPAWGPI